MRKLAVGALAVGALALAGCQSYDNARGRGDAPVGKVNDNARAIFNQPDKFANISAFCIGDVLVISTTRQAAPVAVANAAWCRQGENQ